MAWSKSAIRAILNNPRYTGHQVWNRQRKDEVLIDVEDVAQGHETVMRWNQESDWIWSPEIAQAPLITAEIYERTRQMTATKNPQQTARTPRATQRTYLLRSLIVCGLCNRRMQGSWNNGRAHYGCKASSQAGTETMTGHPRAVYVREDEVLAPLDRWLASAFDPDRIDDTAAALGAASEDPSAKARQEAARQALRRCDDKLAKYRAALEAGVDPDVVGKWINEVRGERQQAELALQRSRGTGRMTKSQIKDLINQLGDIVATVKEADPADRAEVYARLGLRLTYEPERRVFTAEAQPTQPCTKACVRGGT